jgi:hypothetical protein
MTMAEALNDSDPALLYEQDFAAWLDLQVAALRERRFADLDLDNLIEEVESIRRAEARSVEHHARVVVAQLLQLAHSTLGDPRRSCKSTANSHRDALETRLTDVATGTRGRTGESLPKGPQDRRTGARDGGH